MPRPVPALFATTLAAGLFELVLVPFMDVPVAAAVFAVVFLACAALTRRHPRVWVASLAGLAFAVELSGLPVYERDSLTDWIVQGAFGALSAAGLAAAVASVLELRRQRLRVAAR